MPETSKLLTEGEKKWLGELDAKYRDVDYTKLGGKLMFSVSSNAKIVKMSNTHAIAISKEYGIAEETVVSDSGKINVKRYVIN